MEDNVSEYNQESDKESNSMLMSMTERSSEVGDLGDIGAITSIFVSIGFSKTLLTWTFLN